MLHDALDTDPIGRWDLLSIPQETHHVAVELGVVSKKPVVH
jgi:hypothetical protein